MFYQLSISEMVKNCQKSSYLTFFIPLARQPGCQQERAHSVDMTSHSLSQELPVSTAKSHRIYQAVEICARDVNRTLSLSLVECYQTLLLKKSSETLFVDMSDLRCFITTIKLLNYAANTLDTCWIELVVES